jgi:hypothetical protein
MRLFIHGRKPDPQGHNLVGSCQQVAYSLPRLVHSGRSRGVRWLFVSSILFVLLSLLLMIPLIQREPVSESEDDEFKSDSNRKQVSSLFNSGLSVLICKVRVVGIYATEDWHDAYVRCNMLKCWVDWKVRLSFSARWYGSRMNFFANATCNRQHGIWEE